MMFLQLSNLRNPPGKQGELKVFNYLGEGADTGAVGNLRGEVITVKQYRTDAYPSGSDNINLVLVTNVDCL